MFPNILKHAIQHALHFTLAVSQWKRSVILANRKYLNETELKAQSQSFKKELYNNIAKDAAEFLTGNSVFKETSSVISEYPVQYDGLKLSIGKNSAEVLEEMKKGGLMLTAHFGNYEAMGPWLCRLGIPLKASYSKIKPAQLNVFLESKLRSADGYSYSTFIKNPKDILRLIDAHDLFCLLADQDYRKSSSVHAKFLGKPVNCNPIPSFILRHRPMTPVYICWIEQKSKEYILCATSIKIKHSDEAIQKFNVWLEKRISENSSRWYGWLHRRFKSSIETNKNIY